MLPGKIAESVAAAVRTLREAKVGWASVDDAEHTHCRRWIRRPDRLVVDPFGIASARAHMHPGYQSPDAVGPSGPVDPELSVLSAQTTDGKPIAVLANYSMHYFGAAPVSADYFGRFSRSLAKRIGAGPGFVAMMSQGTSGDQHWMDYGAPKREITMDAYADAVAASAERAYTNITYREDLSLAMAETTLRLGRRVPDEARLQWARGVAATMGDRAPRTLPEVYAKEAIYLHDEPERELKLQALRVGDLAIAAIPDEVFALTGLKIKARSPLANTFTIELANGSEGYIPPPEQHALGGYTTWPARTAALEVQAEPKILDAVLALLGRVSDKPVRTIEQKPTPYARAVLAARPWAFWRFEEMDGSTASDATGNGHAATLRPGFALFLDGVPAPDDAPARPASRAVHLVGGSVEAEVKALGSDGTVTFSFWSGLPNDILDQPATLLEREGSSSSLAIRQGRLCLIGNDAPRTTFESAANVIEPRRWYQLAIVQAGSRTTVFLEGRQVISHDSAKEARIGSRLWIGGKPGRETFQGKIDDAAVFERPLTPREVAELYQAIPRR
jgi:hypothetical protein